MRLTTDSQGMASSYTEAERKTNTAGRPRDGTQELA